MRRTLLYLALTLPLGAQSGAKNGEWTTYGADLGNTHYSPLDQITAGNFNKLQVAWRLKTDNFGPRPETNLQSTPLMVKGVLYTTAGTRRAVVALNAGTGEVLWTHSEDEGARGANAPRQLSGRGLAYWTDGREERIVYVTPGYRMIALNAKTGVPVPGFGRTGVVDLKLDDDQEIDLETGEVGLHATPVVAGDVVIVGAAHRASGSPKVKHNVNGYVRGFDAKWMRESAPADEALVGSADIQSLADLGSGYEVVRTMRGAPITMEGVIQLVAAVLLPISPLLLTMMSMEELANKLFSVLL